MKSLKLNKTLLMGLVASATALAPAAAQSVAGSAPQQSRQSQSFRTQTREFFVSFEWATAPVIAVENVFIPSLGTNDTILQIDDKDLYGLGFGWNIDERWNVWGDMTFGSPKYEARWGDELITGRGDMWKGRLMVDFNLLDRPFTPFVSGGVGFMYFDSGVPSGRTDVWCWWDYFWGIYVCSADTPTHSTWEFTWNGSAGLRWDVTDQFFAKAAVNWMWADVGASGNQTFTNYLINVGWTF